MVCECGGRMVAAEGMTGYYPRVPHKCSECGVVDYVEVDTVADARVNIDAVENMRHVCVKVTIKRDTELRWRLRLATWLLNLVGLLMNCEVEIKARHK